FTYYEGQTRLPEGAVPDVKSKSFTITTDIELPKGDESGVIVTQGGLFGGYALLFDKGKPVFHYNLANIEHTNIAAKAALAAGKHRLVMKFVYDGGGVGKGGTATLEVDGAEVASGKIGRTTPIRFSLDEGMDIGEDTGTPVTLDYDVPHKFTGHFETVTIEIVPGAPADAKAGEDANRKGAERKNRRD
ncbi:MAG: arylsulfatase, partial [Planctomycetes bacterium]|nr:arylsulfatase [Planctomycetota bacterium]